MEKSEQKEETSDSEFVAGQPPAKRAKRMCRYWAAEFPWSWQAAGDKFAATECPLCEQTISTANSCSRDDFLEHDGRESHVQANLAQVDASFAKKSNKKNKKKTKKEEKKKKKKNCAAAVPWKVCVLIELQKTNARKHLVSLICRITDLARPSRTVCLGPSVCLSPRFSVLNGILTFNSKIKKSAENTK